eukprot:TRINITY_DN23029_c0_g2_i1.p1 TRINITY_DN23029_c0_g2~~TRINITY_DN23029_c0_g2_i1.p1  ORF type:complete len:777 (-),score=116.40 TRINITY_DN23029_c0_g2_i1:324-2654(-)
MRSAMMPAPMLGAHAPMGASSSPTVHVGCTGACATPRGAVIHAVGVPQPAHVSYRAGMMTPSTPASPVTPTPLTPSATLGWSTPHSARPVSSAAYSPPLRYHNGVSLAAALGSPCGSRGSSPVRPGRPQPLLVGQRVPSTSNVLRTVAPAGAAAVVGSQAAAALSQAIRVATTSDAGQRITLTTDSTQAVGPLTDGTGLYGMAAGHRQSSSVYRRCSTSSADRSFSPASSLNAYCSTAASHTCMESPSALATAAAAAAPWLSSARRLLTSHSDQGPGAFCFGIDSQAPLTIPGSPAASLQSAKVIEARNIFGGASAGEDGIVLRTSPRDGAGSKTLAPDASPQGKESGRDSRRSSSSSPRKAWIPSAKNLKLDFLSHRNAGASTPRSSTPRSSASSSPQRRSERFQGLFDDAAARKLRLQKRKEEKERQDAKVLEPWYESAAHRSRSGSNSRRRRSSSRDRSRERRGSLYDLAEEKLQRLEQAQATARAERRLQEERELQECTFKPTMISSRRNSVRRTSSVSTTAQELVYLENDSFQTLRQLAHKQSTIRGRLEHLEREWRLAHERVEEAFSKRVMELQEERKAQVSIFLGSEEGLEYLKDQEAHLTSQPGVTSEDARQQVFDELMQDAAAHNSKIVQNELEPQYRQVERDFQTKIRVSVHALDDIEDRAQRALRALKTLPDFPDMLKCSGFVEGLAAEAAEAAQRGGDAIESPCAGATSAQPRESVEAESTGGTGAAPSLKEVLPTEESTATGTVPPPRQHSRGRLIALVQPKR